jgi:hypothetical protein
MNRRILIIVGLLALCVVNVMPGRAIPPIRTVSGETFSALAYLPAGPGAGRTADVTITINAYSSPEEVQSLHALLIDRGPDVVLKALEKMKPKGRISLTGTVGFYDWKVIMSVPSPTGRHIMAAADRPISFLEQYYGTRSSDYKFGFMELDLNQQNRGEGSLIYAAKVKVMNSDKVEIENLGIEPIKLMGVRKL